MSAEEKDYYEREADKQNELHPMEKDVDRSGTMGMPPGPPPPAYGPPPPDYGAPPDYGMPGPPPVIHQPSGYDSRGYYGGGGSYPPPMHGGYDYYGQPYPPGPPGPPPPNEGGRGGAPSYPPPSYPPYPHDDRGGPAYM